MNTKQFVKTFVAGLAFPAVCVPLVYGLASYMHPGVIGTDLSSEYLPVFIPLMFGAANLFYVRISKIFVKTNKNNLLLITGVILGIIVSLLHMQTIIFDFFPGFVDNSLIILPVFYALIFRFIIKWLNELFEV